MKKILVAILVLLLFVPAALAADLPLVVDDAILLTEDEVQTLTEEAERISAEYKMDVVILTVDGMAGQSARNYAADYYDYEGYGQGADMSGILLLLSMEERDWFILTTGGAIQAFTDYAIDVMDDDIIHYFSDGNYAEGFTRFLRDVEIFLAQNEKGAPYDVDNQVQIKTVGERTVAVLPWVLGISVLIAVGGLFFLARGMNTARPAYSANRYVREGSMNITRAGDYFLYHTQTRVKIPKNQSGGRGGSSTFRGSSGTTHGGGGGKF